MSTPLRVFALAALIGASAPASAARGPSAERAVNTLSRSAARLARTRFANKTFTAYRGSNFSLKVRPAAKVIVLQKGLKRTGFFLDKQGRLPKAQAAKLARMLRNEPRATSDVLLRGLLRSSNQLRKQERRLATQLPLITSLLKKASRVGGTRDREIWRGTNGSITYRPQAKVLVGSGRFARKGFFLYETARGLEVQGDYVEGLQSFLLESK